MSSKQAMPGQSSHKAATSLEHDDLSGNQTKISEINKSKLADTGSGRSSVYNGVDDEEEEEDDGDDDNTLVGSDISSLNIKTSPVQEYIIHPNWNSHRCRIVPASAGNEADHKISATYIAEHSRLTPKTPDITLHRGAGKDCPIVGVCRLRFGLHSFTCGIGDLANGEENMAWESLKRHGFFSSRHWDFSIAIPSDSRSGSTRKTFTWKRTHSNKSNPNTGGDSQGRAHSMLNRKLIDSETGEVVALFLRNKGLNLKKLGKLTLFKDFGEEWEIMVLLTLLGMMEKARRQRMAAAAAAGGSG